MLTYKITADHEPISFLDIDRDINECELCDLHKFISHKVLGEGDIKADIMFLGENPGPQEFKQSRPFVNDGKAGERFNNCLKEFPEFERKNIYVTNACKCWRYAYNSKGKKINKNPDYEHVDICKHHLIKEICYIKPKVIIAMGNKAMRALIEGFSGGITKIHGNTYYLTVTHREKQFTSIVIPVYHPSHMDYHEEQPELLENFKTDLRKAYDIWKFYN